MRGAVVGYGHVRELDYVVIAIVAVFVMQNLYAKLTCVMDVGWT